MSWFTSSRETLPDEVEQLLFPARHTAKALERHASGLRLSLYGLIMVVVGLPAPFLLLIGPRINLDLKFLAWGAGAGAILALIGSFVNMWGKYRCFEFPIQLDGRWLLTVAIWCDGIVLMSRFASRIVPVLKVVRLADPLLLLLGFVFFLLFLRSLADVIHRADLKRSVGYVLGAGCAVLVSTALGIGGAAVRQRMPGVAVINLAVMFVGLLALVVTMAMYARLLWQMSHGLDDFAKYLLAAEDHLAEEDVDDRGSNE